MVEKLMVTPEQVLQHCSQLAGAIYASHYHPTIVATLLWGGAQVGHYVHNFLSHRHRLPIRANIAVQCKVGYGSQEELEALQGKDISVELGRGFMDLAHVLRPDDRLLVCDEVCHTGATLRAITTGIETVFDGKRPEIRTAVLHFKPEQVRDGYRPHYFIDETNAWVVYPWNGE